jgi:mono/diheme cytochrome c family protein
MKKIVKAVGLVLGGVLGLAVLAAGVIFAWSSMILERTYEFAPRAVVVPFDPESLAQGKKVALTRGCLGCHGENAQGGLFVDIPWVARVPAPGLTQRVHAWSIEELDRSIRQGLRENGKSVFGMPSGMYQHLSDEDFGALIAFLRSLPRSDQELGRRFLGLPARMLIVQGELAPERVHFAAYLEAQSAHGDVPAQGKYLAQTTCSECHGPNLHGWAADAAPSLAIVAAYSPEEFLRLMTTGESASGRELGLMKAVSLDRFAHFAPEEIEAIYAYLTSPEFYSLEPGYLATR